MKLSLISPVVSEKMFENVGRRTLDGRIDGNRVIGIILAHL